MTPLAGQSQITPEDNPTADCRHKRPGPLRWIWYAFGGALGPRYREWVLHDLTCQTRWARQLARAVVQVVPVAAVVVYPQWQWDLAGSPGWVRAAGW